MNQHGNMLSSKSLVLKDKDGNAPPPDIECLLQGLDKELLFPCPSEPDDLEMPQKDSGVVPREMNSFMVFRRQLAYVFKQRDLSNDGKILSRASSYIWNGANKDEKESYIRMAQVLKQRHLDRYPNYTYERKKRKSPEEEFIHVNTDTYTFKVTKKKKKVQTLQTKVDSKSNLVNEKGTPASTSLAQEQEKVWFYNSLAIPTNDISWDIQESYQSHNVESYNTCPQEGSRYNYVDENIPKITSEILSLNYTDVNPLQQFQQLQLIQQQQLQQQLPEQQLSPSYLQQQLPEQLSPSYLFGEYSEYLMGGGSSGISEPLGGVYGLEKSIDEVFSNINS